MESRLEKRIEEAESRLQKRIEDTAIRLQTRFDKRIQESEDRSAALTASEVGSLHTELQKFRAEINQRLARIDERLDRQGFMLSGGIKALGAMLEHLTTVESN